MLVVIVICWIIRTLQGMSFMIPQQVDFETENAKFFEDVEFAGGNTVLD